MIKLTKFLLFPILVIVACSAARQGASHEGNTLAGNKAYIPLRKFKGDTVRYMKYNFIEQKAVYLGQPLNKLVQALEIAPKEYITGSDVHDMHASPYMYLDIFTQPEIKVRAAQKKDPTSLVVTWEKPLPMDTMMRLIRMDHGDWKGASKAYFEKQVVKDIKIVEYNFLRKE